jgi:hypothetical protein
MRNEISNKKNRKKSRGGMEQSLKETEELEK